MPTCPSWRTLWPNPSNSQLVLPAATLRTLALAPEGARATAAMAGMASARAMRRDDLNMLVGLSFLLRGVRMDGRRSSITLDVRQGMAGRTEVVDDLLALERPHAEPAHALSQHVGRIQDLTHVAQPHL